MVGVAGTGRTFKWISVSDLRQSETMILESLLNWDYQNMKASNINIALITNLSTTAVYYGTKYLRDVRGIIAKSHTGSWFIKPNLKKMFLQEKVEAKKLEPKENMDQQVSLKK